MPRARIISSSPDVSSADESTPKAKRAKKEQAPARRTTRAEATRISTGSKPTTATRTTAAQQKPTPSAESKLRADAKPKTTSKPTKTGAKSSSASAGSKSKGGPKPSKQNSAASSGTRTQGRDVKREQDNEEGEGAIDALPPLEVENDDWRATGSKRPALDAWLFPKRVKPVGKLSKSKHSNFADEPSLEHVLRAHSRNTHDGQDEEEVDTWAVAFQPTLPVLRRNQTSGGADATIDESESEDESDDDNDEDDEEIRIRRRNKRLAKELSLQPPKSSSIVATCGGNTICLIDCGLGKVMAKYSHVEEEEFMALAWTTLDHDQESEGGDADTMRGEGRPEQTNILAAAGRLGSIKLINPLQNTCYKYLHGHTDSITRLKFSLTNPRWLFSASTDGSVRLWDIGSLTGFETEARCLAEFTRKDDASVTAIGVSEKYLIVGTDQGVMAQYNLFELNTKLETERAGVRTRKVSPERIYPVSQEWHESSVDDIIYIPYFSEKSYAAQQEAKESSKADKKSIKGAAGTRGGGGRGRGRGRGGRDRGQGRGGSSSNRDPSTESESDSDSDSDSDDSDSSESEEEEEDDDVEYVFASRESCQGEFIVWDASKSTATDAALKTILEWSIAESWTKFTVAENKVPNQSLKRATTTTSSSKKIKKTTVESMEWTEKRQSVLVAGTASGSIALYDLARPPRRALDGNIIACKPDRIISNGVSKELLRDVAVSEDLSMIVGGDWANKVLLWSRDSAAAAAGGGSR
ncbi:hypothetical protein BGX33_004004 [Mortierella sp. NVP41]|nr:hypothetical protein BGX33_004004 [Mortierella sp. NVP41]